MDRFHSGRQVWIHALLLLLALTVLTGRSHAEGRKKGRASILPAPPRLTAEVVFQEPSGNNVLDAEERGALRITIRNAGPGDAFEVTASLGLSPDLKGLSFDRNMDFGTVPSGGAEERIAPIAASASLSAGLARLTISFTEANGFPPDSLSVSFPTSAFRPPELIISDLGINDPNENGKIEQAEVVEVTARILNRGEGEARGVVVEVETGENVFPAAGSKGHFELGALPSGGHKDVTFSFYTNRLIQDGERIPVTLRIREERPKFAVAEPLDLRMNAPQKASRELVVEAIEHPRVQQESGSVPDLSVDVDREIPIGESAGPNDVAVVIGNKNYRVPGVPKVEYADRDAGIVREHLIETFGFLPENIIYERDATLSKFNEIFGTAFEHKGKLYRYVKKDHSRVFVYYVGHGAPDLEANRAFIVPVDANPHSIATTGYRVTQLYENLQKIPAKGYMVVLDACFSGNTMKGMLLTKVSPALVRVKQESANLSNAVIILSGTEDQVATWYPEKRHSMLTYFFLKGIRGAADSEKDGVITAGELRAYLNEQVPYASQRYGGVQQTPQISGDDKTVVVKLKP